MVKRYHAGFLSPNRRSNSFPCNHLFFSLRFNAVKNILNAPKLVAQQETRIKELETDLARRALTEQSRKPNQPQWYEYWDPLQGADLQTLTPGTKRGVEPLPAKCSFGTRSSTRTA